jgi:hypothetical protein
MSPDAATANENVIILADRVEARFQRRIPILEATGVSLDPWEGDLLSKDLKDTSSTLGRVLATLTDSAMGDRSIFQLRTAALLRRVQGAVKLAAKRAEKLERKLSKAKRKDKRRC